MLLYWHFRQAVLTNMRGAGEPVFEHDFLPGSVQITVIMRGPQPGARMVFELATRIWLEPRLFYNSRQFVILLLGMSSEHGLLT